MAASIAIRRNLGGVKARSRAPLARGTRAAQRAAAAPIGASSTGVYCISLRSREDRARGAWRELHWVGLCDRVIFHRPEKDSKPTRGCWESHRAVAADARRQRRHGLGRVLVLEDDVAFTRSLSAAHVRRIRAAIDRLPADWMGFYLGHWALWALPAGWRTLRCSSLCTHAYVASERLLDWLGRTPFERRDALRLSRIVGRGVDSAFAALPQMFAIFPAVAVQRFETSDHLEARRIRLRRAHRDLFVLSRMREFAMAYAMGLNEKLVHRPDDALRARRARGTLARDGVVASSRRELRAERAGREA